jgi:LacI family transcriptional regulator
MGKPMDKPKAPATNETPLRSSRTGSVSIKEIARLSGVSIGTVDRVVHNRGRVLEETARKIRRIIEETGYRPNIFASRLSRARLYRFGVMIPSPDQDSCFWQLPLRGIEKAALELKSHSISITYYFFNKYTSSRKSFASVCKRIQNDAPDGLLLAPVIPDWTREFLTKLSPAIPYVFFDSNLPDTDPVSTIIQDSFQSGVLSAKLADLLAEGTGKIGIFQLVPTDFHLLERARGFHSYFSGHPRITCLESQIDGSRLADSFTEEITAMRKTHADLKVIFVTNAQTYQAAAFLKRQSRKKEIHVIGYDLIPDNTRLLEEGWIDFLINQRPETQGYQGLYTLYRHLVLGETAPPCMMMPIDIIAKENAFYYQNESTDHEKMPLIPVSSDSTSEPTRFAP